MGSLEAKRHWNRWIWERPWIGYPSAYARSLGWVAPSHPYPAGFIPIWDMIAWKDFAKISKMELAFEIPGEIGNDFRHEGALARKIETSDDYLLLYKTLEEEYPYPPEWELVTVNKVNGSKRRLGYFQELPSAWTL